MPALAVQLAIGDYAKWRSVFDGAKSLRDKIGLANVQIYRNADNANSVLVWSETADAAKAQAALATPEFRSAMQEAGVVGPPKIHIIP